VAAGVLRNPDNIFGLHLHEGTEAGLNAMQTYWLPIFYLYLNGLAGGIINGVNAYKRVYLPGETPVTLSDQTLADALNTNFRIIIAALKKAESKKTADKQHASPQNSAEKGPHEQVKESIQDLFRTMKQAKEPEDIDMDTVNYKRPDDCCLPSVTSCMSSFFSKVKSAVMCCASEPNEDDVQDPVVNYHNYR
jgi:hypothetical protein